MPKLPENVNNSGLLHTNGDSSLPDGTELKIKRPCFSSQLGTESARSTTERRVNNDFCIISAWKYSTQTRIATEASITWPLQKQY